MAPYRQSNRYTQQLERELGEAQKRAEKLAWDLAQSRSRPREPFWSSYGGCAAGIAIIMGGPILAFMLGAAVLHLVGVDMSCEPEQEVLVCAEADGSCRTLVEAD